MAPIPKPAKSDWSLDGSAGELLIRTGVAGPAAKMGHRLTIAVTSWRAVVRWRSGKPVGVELAADVDSLVVISGDGGVTPLSGPEKKVARSNALRSLEAKNHPRIHFAAEAITKTADGYRLTGTVEIHGQARPQVVDVAITGDDAVATITARTRIAQSDFGVKPFSLLMGALKVADEVAIDFHATLRHPR